MDIYALTTYNEIWLFIHPYLGILENRLGWQNSPGKLENFEKWVFNFLPMNKILI